MFMQRGGKKKEGKKKNRGWNSGCCEVCSSKIFILVEMDTKQQERHWCQIGCKLSCCCVFGGLVDMVFCALPAGVKHTKSKKRPPVSPFSGYLAISSPLPSSSILEEFSLREARWVDNHTNYIMYAMFLNVSPCLSLSLSLSIYLCDVLGGKMWWFLWF